MTAFAAALNALNLSQQDATELIALDGRVLKRSTVADWAGNRSRIPADVWQRMADLFVAVEAAADDIIADQGELGGGEGLLQHTVLVATIPLPHHKLRAAAAARAMLVLGPQLLALVDERERVS